MPWSAKEIFLLFFCSDVVALDWEYAPEFAFASHGG